MDADSNLDENVKPAKSEEYKTFDKTLDPKLKEYLEWEKVECNITLVQELAKKKDLKTLKSMLCRRLDLSNGGIRGDMVPGFNGMNDLVAIQTGQGLIKYLEETNREKLVENGIIIGYDARFNSKKYADRIATIFLNQNYPVRMFGKEVITPFVPLAIKMYSSVAGVMVGGGAFPKSFNGIKIFGPNGCEVIPPVETEIESYILKNLEPIEESWNVDILDISYMLSDPYQEVVENYLNYVSESLFRDYKAEAAKAVIKFVYTPLHGVAYDIFKKVVDNHCLMVEPVTNQINPDPKFPSVKIPDPSDPRSLDNAKLVAERNKIPYILATDPDGCRMVFAHQQTSPYCWKTYTANEIGTLFGWWALDQYKQSVSKPNLKNIYMIASTASSKILQSMAKEDKFNFVETLPGFKWIGNQAYDLKAKDKKTIFSFEESDGYMFSDELLHKDGIQACVQIMTMICYLDAKGIRLSDKLDEIYTQYGFHLCMGSYFKGKEYDDIVKIFNKLRAYEEPSKLPDLNCHCVPEAYKPHNQKQCSCNPYPPSCNIKMYPKSIGNGKYEITRIRDITLGFDNNEPSRKSVLPAQPDMEMITFEFTNGLVATLRTNPKEPKLRFCAELILKPDDLMTKSEGMQLVNEMMHKLIHDFISPAKNRLTL